LIPQLLPRVLVLGGLVALLTAVALSDAAHAWAQQVLAYVAEVIARHPHFGRLLFVALAALSAMLAFFSSALVVPVGIHAWGPWTTAALLWTGWLLGGVCAYWIGRGLGRRVAAWFVASKRLDYYEARIRHASFATILLFQTALPSEIPGYVLGSLRYRFLAYLLALAVVELPFSLGAVYLGDSFVNRKYHLIITIGIAGIALSALGLWYLRRRIG
jgi:uncharacterized membrane protein YdjX (TVP38/TMEM64 family)